MHNTTIDLVTPCTEWNPPNQYSAGNKEYMHALPTAIQRKTWARLVFILRPHKPKSWLNTSQMQKIEFATLHPANFMYICTCRSVSNICSRAKWVSKVLVYFVNLYLNLKWSRGERCLNLNNTMLKTNFKLHVEMSRN